MRGSVRTMRDYTRHVKKLRWLSVLIAAVLCSVLVIISLPESVDITGYGKLSIQNNIVLAAMLAGGEEEFIAPTIIQSDKNLFEATFTGGRIVIGDSTTSDFKPLVRIERWDSEVFIELDIPQVSDIAISGKNATLSSDAAVVIWSTPAIDLKLYTKPKNEQYEYGAFEYELVLKWKPPVNTFEFPINSSNLVFYYQPPLTDEYQDGWSKEFQDTITVTETEVRSSKGEVLVHRPENVVGSYAVYHAEKNGIYKTQAEADKYKTGKAFHIYRPYVYDSTGKGIWADMKIANGQLTITVDQAWLNSAVYPVVIDPTFGYTAKASSQRQVAANFFFGPWATGAAGTAQSITCFYQQSGTDTPKLKHALYQKTGTLAGSYVSGSGTEEWTLTSGWNNWKTLNCLTPPSISAIDYWIFLWNNANVFVYRDSAAANSSGYQAQTYNGWPATASLTTLSYIYSIYCTYTLPPPDISNAPSFYNFGSVAEGATPASELTHFTVTNNSSFAVNITISGNDMTGGGFTWTLSDGAIPGPNTYGLMAGLEGGGYTIIVRKNSPYNTLVSNLAASGGTQRWGLQLYAPTTFSDGAAKTGTVTLTATSA